MVAYASNELISSSDFAKKFGSYLSQQNLVDKIAILKNNNIEAVLVSKNEYELMKKALEIQEQQEIFNIIKQREATDNQRVSFEDMAKWHNINLDEL